MSYARVIVLWQQRRSQQAYETQISTVTKSISELEAILQQSVFEKSNLMRDLQAVRDLSARLESSRDAVQRQLSTKNLEQEQVTYSCIYSCNAHTL